MDLTEERFGEVVRAARSNLQLALDLITIHSEAAVKGPQPRASLNPFTVVAAIGSWERFVADLASAASFAGESWNGPGGHRSRPGAHAPEALDGYLAGSGVTDAELSTRWEVKFPTRWVGVKPQGWRTLDADSTPEQRADFAAYLSHARRARNGAAHAAMLHNAVDIADEDGWYHWNSDAQSETVQSGYARGVTAVHLQLIDATAALIALDHGWDTVLHRMPPAWFDPTTRTSRYPQIQFWAGEPLHRLLARPVSRAT
jgi:hypothetical protein